VADDVLLSGISTLIRLVAREREPATRELHDTLVGLFSAQQRAALDLLGVPPGMKISKLERWRIGPSKASIPQLAGEAGSGGGAGVLGCRERPVRPRGGHRRPGRTARCGSVITGETGPEQVWANAPAGDWEPTAAELAQITGSAPLN
jgi:hypothetical protein